MSEESVGLRELARRLAMATVRCTNMMQDTTGQQTASSSQQQSDRSPTEKDRLFEAWYRYFLQLHQQDSEVEKWLHRNTFAHSDNMGNSTTQGTHSSAITNAASNEYVSEIGSKGISTHNASLTWQAGGSVDATVSMMLAREGQHIDGRMAAEVNATRATPNYVSTGSLSDNSTKKPTSNAAPTNAVCSCVALDGPTSSNPHESKSSPSKACNAPNCRSISNATAVPSKVPPGVSSSSRDTYPGLLFTDAGRKCLAQTPHNSIDDEWMASSCRSLPGGEFSAVTNRSPGKVTEHKEAAVARSLAAGHSNCQVTLATSVNLCEHNCTQSAFQTLHAVAEQKEPLLTEYENENLRRFHTKQKTWQRYVVRVTNIERHCHCGKCGNSSLPYCDSMADANENPFSRVYVTFQAYLPDLTPKVKSSNEVNRVAPADTTTGLRIGFICSLASRGPSLQDFTNPQIAEKMDMWEQAGGMPGLHCQVLSALHDTVELILQQIRENGLTAIQLNADYIYFPPTIELRPLHGRRRQSSASSDGSLPRLAAARQIPGSPAGSPQHPCMESIAEASSGGIPIRDRHIIWSQPVREMTVNRCRTWHSTTGDQVPATGASDPPGLNRQSLLAWDGQGQRSYRALAASSDTFSDYHGQQRDRFRHSNLVRSTHFLPVQPEEKSQKTAFSLVTGQRETGVKSCDSGELEKLPMTSTGRMNTRQSDDAALKNITQEISHRLRTKTDLPLVIMPTKREMAPTGEANRSEPVSSPPLVFQLPYANSAFVCLPATATHMPRVVTVPRNTALIVLPAASGGSGSGYHRCSNCPRGACSQPFILTGPRSGYLLLLNDDNRFEYIPKK